MKAELTYYIVEGVLVGTVGRKLIHMPARSGGGGGSTAHTPQASANNPYMTGLKMKNQGGQHVHGGPVPPGKYRIEKPAHHPHLGRSSRLVPTGSQPMFGRGGFYIHGRGTHGSDGCIVPLSPGDFAKLMQTLEGCGGGTLVVQESMEDSRLA